VADLAFHDGAMGAVGLGWFEEMAARRGVVLDAPMHPVTRAYCDSSWH
jgi:hypothetical protein